MCRFWSGYVSADLAIFDAKPYDSHSRVIVPAGIAAASIEAWLEGDKLVFDPSHPLPSWWNAAAEAALTGHIAKRAAELVVWEQTREARREKQRAYRFLRKVQPDRAGRAALIKLAGHGDPLVAVHHIKGIQSARAQTQDFADTLQQIRERQARRWLAALSDDYIEAKLGEVQGRCKVRVLRVSSVRRAINRVLAGETRVIVDGGQVAKAYYKIGYNPTTTEVVVDLAARCPLRIGRVPCTRY